MEKGSPVSSSQWEPETSKASSSKTSVDEDDDDDQWGAPSLEDLRRHVRALEKEKAEWRALLAERRDSERRRMAADTRDQEAADADGSGSSEALVPDADLRFIADAPDYAAAARGLGALLRIAPLATQHHREFVEGASTLTSYARARATNIIRGLLLHHHDDDDVAAPGPRSTSPSKESATTLPEHASE